MKQVDEIKNRQMLFVNHKMASLGSIEYESNYYHDYFRALPFITLKRLLDRCNLTLNGKTVLIAGCGTGIDVHYLRKWWEADFVVCDISEKAVHIALRLIPNLKGSVQDIEKLTFADESFDYVFVAHTLHHLPRPLIGLYELIRVAKYGVIVIEPNDSWLTCLATRLKLAREIEEAGNYVYRFNAHDVERISRALFYKCHYIRLFATHLVARNKLEFVILRTLNSLGNLLAPAQGNYIVFIIEKS